MKMNKGAFLLTKVAINYKISLAENGLQTVSDNKARRKNMENINQDISRQEAEQTSPKKKSKLPIIIIALAAIIAIAAVVLLLPGDEKESDYIVVNESGKSLYLVDVANPGKEPVLIDEIRGDGSTYIAPYISQDDSTIVYINNDRQNDDYEIFYDLMLFDIATATTKALAEDVYTFSTNEDCSVITYFKGESCTLCRQRVGGEEEVIGEKLISYYTSVDGNRLIYVNEKEEMFFLKDGEAEKIAVKAEIIDVNDDLSEALYCEDGKLIKFCDGEKTVLCEKFYNNIWFSDTVTCEKGYFYEIAEVIKIEDYFVDDMLESDKAISASDTQAASEKLIRDALRIEIGSYYENPVALLNLYYYDGKDTVLVDENVVNNVFSSSYYHEQEHYNVCCYIKAGDLAIDKIVMSEAYEKFSNSFLGVTEHLLEAVSEAGSLSFAKDGKALGSCDIKNAVGYLFDGEDTFYIQSELLREDYLYDYSYYGVPVTATGLGEVVTYAENACCPADIFNVIDGEVIYGIFEDEGEERYTIYKATQPLAEHITYTDFYETGSFYAKTEDPESFEVSAVLYADGQLTPGSDLHEYETGQYTKNGSFIVFEYDEPELSIFRGGETVKIEFKKINEVYFPLVSESTLYDMSGDSSLFYEVFAGQL